MSILCPRCKSSRVEPDASYRDLGALSGAGAGAAAHLSGKSLLSLAGAAAGSVVPGLGTVIGAFVGSILGAAAGVYSGAKLGSQAGEVLNNKYRSRHYRCRNCGKLFVF